MAVAFEDSKKPTVRDFVWQGIESGWKHMDASQLDEDQSLTADVVIIGTGSGGGTASEILAQAGLDVVIVEEGPLQTSKDFNMSEAEAFAQLYQESAARKTKDHGIMVLQGRMVGGGTGVNWTTSFRIPTATLEYWTNELGLKGFTEEEMKPWFELVEKRYNIHYWKIPPNENNATIERGCEKLGLEYGHIRRNVRGCQNLGYCGVGCPVNAKQSTLLTTIPGALRAGATLISRARGEKLDIEGGKVQGITCVAMNPLGTAPSGKTISIKAKHVVLAAGAIGTPAILLRSGDQALNPHGLVGTRTFVHPVAIMHALMPHPVNGDAGAPQSIYTDHYIHTRLDNQRMGYKIETAPMQPFFVSANTPTGWYGSIHTELMKLRPNLSIMLALMRDGFHPDSIGGSVYLKDDGTPGLDYPISDYVWDGIRDSLIRMAEIQFAAGAEKVLPMHRDGKFYGSLEEATAAIEQLPMKPIQMLVGSAHVMGGCMMGEDPTKSVVSNMGRHHEVENLSIFDGSEFPTSIAANPMQSIHSMVAKQATALAQELTG